MAGKKIAKVALLAVVVIAAVAYSALWFYYASDTKKAIEAAIAEAGKDGQGEIHAGPVSVTGFPLGFNIRIEQIEVNIKPVQNPALGPSAILSFAFSLKDPTIARAGVFSKSIQVILPKTLYMKQETANTQAQSFVLEYDAPPALTLTLDKSPAGFFVQNGNPYPWEEKRLVDYFHSVEMTSQQLKAMLEGSDKIISANGPMRLFFAHDNLAGKEHIAIDTSFDDIETYRDAEAGKLWMETFNDDSDKAMIDYMVKFAQVAGPSDFKFIADFQGSVKDLQKNDASFALKELSLRNKVYDFELSGNVSKTASEALPVGEFTLKARNYNALLDHYIAVTNHFLTSASKALQKAQADTEKPVSTGMPAQVNMGIVNAAKAVLLKAGDLSPDGKDITLVLKREAGGQPMLGKLGIQEVMQIFMEQTAAAQPQVAPQPLPHGLMPQQ